jgi:two-component system, NtrC family, nitrogen regulation response regulator NtrX
LERELELVLVVEADPPVRELLSDVLCDEGYEVMTAYDGEHARNLVASRRFDVVAIDLDTPDVSVAGLLRETPGSQPEPGVVALSSAQPPSRSACRAHAVLVKPFNVDELIEAVRRVLLSRRASERRTGAARRRSGRGRAYGAPERPGLRVSLGNGS